MNDIPQIERILRIILILSAGSRLTTKQLLSRFENDVSLRTLQRDFQRIQAAGLPLKSKKTNANENEWYLDSDFRSFMPRTLGLNEYVASHMLRENLKVFRNTNFSHEIDSLIKKIEQIVPESVFMETEDIDPEQLYENYSAGIFDYSSYGEKIEDLIQAILHRRQCFVGYYNANEDVLKRFYIEPHRLVYYSGSLYVIGFIRRFENFVLLAVQRIKKLKVQADVFPETPQFDPQKFWKGKFGLFSSDPVPVDLKFNKSIRYHIEGRLWHPSQTMKSDPDGNLILNMEVGITPELISWILGWSSYVEVLTPTELINEIIKRIKAMQRIYKSGD